MALTRTFLKSIGIEGDKIDPIIEAHADTVEGLKAKIAEASTDAETAKATTAERDKLKADLDRANKLNENLNKKLTAYDELSQERDGLKSELETLRTSVEQLNSEKETTSTELEDLRKQLEASEGAKASAIAEAEKAKTDFDTFKGQVETDKANAMKREAVIKMLRDGGVARSDFQNLIVSTINMDEVKLGENGI